MAYVIGSKKGQDIAKTLTTDKAWTNPADGSVWKKEKDGSVTVTHNGQTTTNAYKPTSKSTGGGGGGSSKKNTYSPYSQNNYTIGSDYGKQVAQGLGIGESFSATDGSKWYKENDGTITVTHNGQTYKNAYTPTDLGILGKQQVEAGLDKDIVAKTYYDRLDKIAKDPTLSAFANDGTMQMLYDYIYGQEIEENYEENLDKFNEGRPDDYSNPYKNEIDYLLKQILNRDDFSYDANSDPLYQQYADMYRREGDRAMNETMAEAAASAGGMNTYAITAAQQAANNYASQLNDRIPELYQLAYQMYLQDKESKVQDLGILQNMDATQYNRYRDTMTDWKDDRNFALGVYNDAVQQGNWNKTFDYNAMVGNRDFGYTDYWANKEFDYNDEWKNKEWDHDIGREQIEDRELAKEEVWKYIALGISSIDPALLAKAEMKQEDVDLAVAAIKAEQGKQNKTTETPETKPPTSPVVNPISEEMTTQMSNYKPIAAVCEDILKTDGKQEVLKFLKERFEAGEIDTNSYNTLRIKYAG